MTAKPFSQVVQEEIARPLGLDGLYIGAPEEVLGRAAELIRPAAGWVQRHGLQLGDALERGAAAWRRLLRVWGFDVDLGSLLDALAPRGISSFDFGAPETLRAAIPAANGLFTARSLARMYAALAGGGVLDGVRLLSRETLRRAIQVQQRAPRRAVLPFDLRWRLGYHAVFTTRGVPREAFGHFGFGGSGAWADPGEELALGFTVNGGIGVPFGDLRIARMSAVALQSARGRARPRKVRSIPPRPAGDRTVPLRGRRSPVRRGLSAPARRAQ